MTVLFGVFFLLALLGCASAAQQPAWPSAFTAHVKVSGSDWDSHRGEDREYRLHVNQNASAIQIDYIGGSSRWDKTTRGVLLRHAAGRDNPSGLVYFFFEEDENVCKYSRGGFFARIIEDFRSGGRFGRDNDELTSLWFPTHMQRVPPVYRDLQWFETTRRSAAPPHVAPWDNAFGSIDYCLGEWNRDPAQQVIGGCDAMKVATWTREWPPSIREITRVHSRARHSYDHDWAYNATLDMKVGVPPRQSFHVPADWRTRCLDEDQAFTVSPSGGRVTTPTGDDYVMIRLARPPISELGVATVKLTHPGHLRAEPSVLQFTEANWDTPQTVALKYIHDGEGRVVVSGTGGGLERVRSNTFYAYACVGRPGYGCNVHMREHGDAFDPAVHLLGN